MPEQWASSLNRLLLSSRDQQTLAEHEVVEACCRTLLARELNTVADLTELDSAIIANSDAAVWVKVLFRALQSVRASATTFESDLDLTCWRLAEKHLVQTGAARNAHYWISDGVKSDFGCVVERSSFCTATQLQGDVAGRVQAEEFKLRMKFKDGCLSGYLTSQDRFFDVLSHVRPRE